MVPLKSNFRKKIATDEDKDKIQRQIKELLRIVSAAADGDFTINALAYDLARREIIDTVGGLQDLADKRIRMVSQNTNGLTRKVQVSSRRCLVQQELTVQIMMSGRL